MNFSKKSEHMLDFQCHINDCKTSQKDVQSRLARFQGVRNLSTFDMKRNT